MESNKFERIQEAKLAKKLMEVKKEKEELKNTLSRVARWAYYNSCYKHGWRPYFERDSNIDKILRPYLDETAKAAGESGIFSRCQVCNAIVGLEPGNDRVCDSCEDQHKSAGGDDATA